MKVRSRHSTKYSKYRKHVQVVTLAGLLIIFGLFVPKIISGIATVLVYPFHATSVWLDKSSSLVPTFFRDRESLLAENESLKNQLVILERNDITQRRLFEENNNLRSLLGVNEETRIAAAVIARPNELPYDFLQIDRGTNSGIEIGAPVFIGKDIVIGLVVYATEEYSFVELVTSPNFNATTFIAGPNVVVTMEGMGGGVARVKVPQGIPLSVGNLVYLPSVEPGIFGKISFVENEPTQPEQYGYITPDIAISGLYRVSVGSLSQISRSTEEIDLKVLELIRTELLNKNLSVGLSSTTASTTEQDNMQE